MQMPRCIIEMSDIAFNTDGLTNQFARGEYERLDSDTNTIKGYNAEIMRVPIEMTINLDTFEVVEVVEEEMGNGEETEE